MATRTPDSAVISIFISYAHEDSEYCQKLYKHCKILEQQGLAKIWYDHELEPGDLWEQEIKQRLETAHVVVFLVSADFISSDFIRNVELKITLDRYREQNKVRIFPVLLHPCLFDPHELSEFQTLPITSKGILQPVSLWTNQDLAWQQVATKLYNYIQKNKDSTS